MAIPKEIVDQIYESAKIEDVVSEYVTLRRRGANLIGLCPFHDERTPSFSVNPARNIYKCFGCGKGGNAVNFVKEIEGCSYLDALRKVAAKYNIHIEERELTEGEQQLQDDRESMFAVNEWANKWFQDQLWKTDEGQSVAYAYFRSRGLSDETIRRFQLGYSPAKGNPMTAAAKNEGFSDKYLANNPETRIGTGICARSGDDGRQSRLYDRFHDRVIFPLLNRTGRTVAFAGRVLVKKDNTGKYVNSPDSILFSKTNELYGLFQAKQHISRLKKCYLVEGQMDCISMSQAGILNVVCSGGTALTKSQINQIHRFTDNVTILYDGDAAGIHAALRGTDMFLEQGLSVKLMLFPNGDDPDSFARKHSAEEFIRYIEQHEEDFIHYKTRTLIDEAGKDFQKRADAIHSIIESIARIADRITREVYIKECSRLMDMPQVTLTQEVQKERKKLYATGNKASGVVEKEKEAQAAQPNNGQGQNSVFDVLDANAQEILRALVLYGDRMMVFAGSNQETIQVLVGDYMQQYMAQTNIQFENALYRSFFDEFNLHKAEPGFHSEQHFIRCENQYIANLAVNLVSEKYQLSRIYTKKEEDAPIMSQHELQTTILRLLYELHYSVVENMLQKLDKQMRDAEKMGDEQQTTATMMMLPQYQSLKITLAQLLGKTI